MSFVRSRSSIHYGHELGKRISTFLNFFLYHTSSSAWRSTDHMQCSIKFVNFEISLCWLCSSVGFRIIDRFDSDLSRVLLVVTFLINCPFSHCIAHLFLLPELAIILFVFIQCYLWHFLFSWRFRWTGSFPFHCAWVLPVRSPQSLYSGVQRIPFYGLPWRVPWRGGSAIVVPSLRVFDLPCVASHVIGEVMNSNLRSGVLFWKGDGVIKRVINKSDIK